MDNTVPERAMAAALSPNERPGDPCVLVIFGAAGDLTQRLLMPSLYNLAQHHLLPHNFAIVGVAREDMSTAAFRSTMRHAVHASSRVGTIDPAIWDNLENRLYYLPAVFDDVSGYVRLQELLAQCDHEHQTQSNYLYYLATPPVVFAEIAQQLGKIGLSQENDTEPSGWRRIVIEKPFGRDLESALNLNRAIQEHFTESQIYRIDHYLGKETVQNVMVFRFANSMLEPVWNRSYIDHVQITVAETVGVETRGNYYDRAGLIRDMVQNHMMQLLALVAMEPPFSFEPDAVRDEKVKVLHAIHPMTHEDVLTNTVRGQYGDGYRDAHHLPAYRNEPNVSPASNTETYAALKLFVDNWRWAGVPFYLRSGKALPQRLTEIVIQFRQAPLRLFRKAAVTSFQPNRLVLQIQPNEGISWQFEAKTPGPAVQMQTVSMDFAYDNFFGSTPSTGYETLLFDVMTGDATLFQRHDFVESAWTIMAPILDIWHNVPARDFPNYPARNSWGPLTADALMNQDGRAWHNLT